MTNIDTHSVYERINKLRSVSDMEEALNKLAKDIKSTVILYALMNSENQFTWSFLAVQSGIPEEDWPSRNF